MIQIHLGKPYHTNHSADTNIKHESVKRAAMQK